MLDCFCFCMICLFEVTIISVSPLCHRIFTPLKCGVIVKYSCQMVNIFKNAASNIPLLFLELSFKTM